MGCHALFQGIVLIQGLNLGLLCCRQILCHRATKEVQEYWSGQPIPSPGDLPNPGIKLRSPVLQVDSLPASLPSLPQGKPKHTGVGSLSILQQILLTQELNRDLLHCRQILYQLSYQGSPVLGNVVQYGDTGRS